MLTGLVQGLYSALVSVCFCISDYMHILPNLVFFLINYFQKLQAALHLTRGRHNLKHMFPVMMENHQIGPQNFELPDLRKCLISLSRIS